MQPSNVNLFRISKLQQFIKMKAFSRFLIVLGTVVLAATSVNAQKPIDLRLSYGGYTQMDATDCHDNWSDVNNAWGALNAEVSFNLTNKFSLGPSYTFSSTTAGDGAHKSNIAYHAIMLNGRYKYWKNSIVTLYGHLGLGVVVSHMQPRHEDAYNCTYFGVQVAPLVQRWASEADSRYMVS